MTTRFEFDGSTYPVADLTDELHDLRAHTLLGGPYEERIAHLERVVREGAVLSSTGAPLPEGSTRRVRARILNPAVRTLDNLEPVSDADRPIIPGLWPARCIPFFGGPPKAGKTRMVIALAAALADPGRRFLDYFGASTLVHGDPGDGQGMTYDGFTLVNAETPAAAFEAELAAELDGVMVRHASGVLVPALDLIDVIHLEECGGPQLFDLSEQAMFDLWDTRLVNCNDCEGEDDWLPHLVIVDGLTAILAAAGKGPEHYGLWIAAFRRLLRGLDIPSGLVVGHNILSGGHALGGTEAQAGSDGLWTYTTDKPDNPLSPRRFSVRPRLGGVAIPPTRVDLDSDGRLVMRRNDQAASAAASSLEAEVAEPSGGPSSDSTINVENQILALVATSSSPPSTRELRTVGGRTADVDAARDRLLEQGRIVRSPRRGRGGGFVFHLPSEAPSAAAEGDRS